MRIFINCSLELGGGNGGTEQFVEGLVRGLAQLDSGHEFILGVTPGGEGWLGPQVTDSMRLLPIPAAEPRRSVRPIEARLRKRLAPAKRRIKKTFGRRSLLPNTNFGRWIDLLNPDVCHFPYQVWSPTRAPSVLNLHDVQHLHFPQFFSKEQLRGRAEWEVWSHQVEILAVGAEWTRLDFIEKFEVSPATVRVVPMASPLEGLAPVNDSFLSRTQKYYSLPTVFGLYPATTWRHKNHVALVEALSLMRNSGLTIICTGRKTDSWWPEIVKSVDELDLGERFRFLDFVSPEELKALYRLATFVIIPSLFEGGGSFAAFEALSEGVPLACSEVTTLTEVVGDAALLFDPSSGVSIANAMGRLLADSQLRDSLREAGTKRNARYSWRSTAKGYVRLYEEVAAKGAFRSAFIK